jgi:hypothetical protein
MILGIVGAIRIVENESNNKYKNICYSSHLYLIAAYCNFFMYTYSGPNSIVIVVQCRIPICTYAIFVPTLSPNDSNVAE